MDDAAKKKLLDEFFEAKVPVRGKGNLSVLFQMSDIVQNDGFPLVFEKYLSPKNGQIARLSGARLKKMLAKRGETRLLASEAGRTSRGTLNLVRDYLVFLNEWENDYPGTVDFDYVIDYWFDRIERFLDEFPLALQADSAASVQSSFNDLFAEVARRQRERRGTQYVGAVLQHLIEAKLAVAMPDYDWEFHGASVADAPTGRSGDIEVGTTSIHCTSYPSRALVDKCSSNIGEGKSPVIITLSDRVSGAQGLLADEGIDSRVEVWSAQQFLASNIFEKSHFSAKEQATTLAAIIGKYNEIVEACETDRSLLIEIRGR